MLTRLWKTAVRVITVVGIGLCFLVVMEVLRAYQALRQASPVLGYAFLAAIACGAAYLAVVWFRAFMLRPPALHVPRIADPARATEHDLRKYARYLCRYMRRLSRNRSLPPDGRRRAAGHRRQLAQLLPARPSMAALVDAVRAAECDTVEPLLAELDAGAQREVRHCVRDVMVGVTLSPFKAADMAIVLFRNAAMISRITHVYNTRPSLREQGAIFVDTLRIVAMVNFITMGKKLMENFFASVPFVGRYVDDVAQGVGAGVLTSTAGHAAIDRCRAFRGWDEVEARRKVAAGLRGFLADCWQIAEEEFRRLPGSAWGKIRTGFSAAIEKTQQAAETFVRVEPAPAAVAAGPDGQADWALPADGTEGPSVGRAILGGLAGAGRAIRAAAGKAARAVRGTFRRGSRT